MNWKVFLNVLLIGPLFASGCLLTDAALIPPRKAIQGADLREDIGRMAVLGYQNAVRQYRKDKSLGTASRIRGINDHYMSAYLLASQYFAPAEEFEYYSERSATECLDTVFWLSNVYAYQYLYRVEASFTRVGDSLVKTVENKQYGEAAVFAASAASDCNLRETGNLIELGDGFGL